MLISAIYDALFAGKTLAVNLPSLGAVHTFRAKLYRYKQQQETVLLAMEMMEKPQALSAQAEQQADGSYQLTIRLRERKQQSARSYEVRILDDEEDATDATSAA